MQEGRWYPTQVLLPDNRVLTEGALIYRPRDSKEEFSLLKGIFELGFRLKRRIVNVQEMFDRQTKTWTMLEPKWFSPLYPRLHLLPEGRVFYTGIHNLDNGASRFVIRSSGSRDHPQLLEGMVLLVRKEWSGCRVILK